MLSLDSRFTRRLSNPGYLSWPPKFSHLTAWRLMFKKVAKENVRPLGFEPRTYRWACTRLQSTALPAELRAVLGVGRSTEASEHMYDNPSEVRVSLFDSEGHRNHTATHESGFLHRMSHRVRLTKQIHWCCSQSEPTSGDTPIVSCTYMCCSTAPLLYPVQRGSRNQRIRWTAPQTTTRDQRHHGGKSQVLHRFNSQKQMGGDDWRAHHGGGTVTYLAECTRPRSLQKEFVRRRKSNAT